MRIDATGAVTNPLQPAFSVNKGGTNQNNLDTTTGVTVTFNTERFDNNSDFDLSNNNFVAPVTGKYLLSATLRVEAVDTASDFVILKMVTSNKTYSHIYDPDVFDQDAVYYAQTITILADMDASDTAEVQMRISGGTQQTDVEGNAEYSYFTGYLVC